jgi:hypothetical protein
MERVDSIHTPRLCPPTFFALMSSPSGYWDDNKISPAILNELAAIEASQVASTSKSMVLSKAFSQLGATPSHRCGFR